MAVRDAWQGHKRASVTAMVVAVAVGVGVASAVAAQARSGQDPASNSSPATAATADRSNQIDLMPASGRMNRFSRYGLSFSYPAGWHVDTSGLPTTLGITLGYLGGQPMRRACVTETNPDGSGSYGCELPVRSLHPGGLLVKWELVSTGLDTAFARLPGAATVVAGHPAKRHAGPDAACAGIGAGSSLQVAIADRFSALHSSTYFLMTACLGARNRAANESTIDRMLASTRID